MFGERGGGAFGCWACKRKLVDGLRRDAELRGRRGQKQLRNIFVEIIYFMSQHINIIAQCRQCRLVL
jgi:hypothetical protein